MPSTLLYSSNFEGGTVGSVPTGWGAISPATPVYAAYLPVSGALTISNTHAASGDVYLLNAGAGSGGIAAADVELRYSFVLPTSVGGYYQGPYPVLRSNAGYTNAYFIVPTNSGTGSQYTLFKVVSGTQTSLTNSTNASNSYIPTPGDTVMVAAYTNGTTIGIKTWKLGTPEPSGYATWTDSSVTTVGYVGIWNYYPAQYGVDDVRIYNTPGAMTYTTTTIATTDPNIVWSPYNWDTIQTSTFTTLPATANNTKQATAPGAYFKFGITGTTQAGLSVDTSCLAGIGTAGYYPVLQYRINNGSKVDVQLVSGQTAVAITGLDPFTTNDIEVVYKARNETAADAWGNSTTSPANAVRINGIIVDTGGTTVYPLNVYPTTAIALADSIGEGISVNAIANAGAPTAAQEPGINDSTVSLVGNVLKQLAVEYGTVCYASQGYEQTGSGNIPGLQSGSSWQYYSSNRSRLSAGKFSPVPNYVLNFHGINGTVTATDVTNWLTAVRAACNFSTWIFLCVNIGGVFQGRSQGIAGYQAYMTAYPGDARTVLIDPVGSYGPSVFRSFNAGRGNGTQLESQDGVHPLAFATGRLAGVYVGLIQQAMSISVSGMASAALTKIGPAHYNT